MGIVTNDTEIASAIPAAKLFKIFLLDSPNTFPKILPQVFRSIEILEGDGGPGTITKTTFAEGTQLKYIKHKVDVVDKDNFIYNYTAVEGDPWLEGLDKISYETKIVASPDGGSISKCTTKYFPKGDSQLNEDKIKEGQQKALELFKAVEAIILANPDAY
ncbi:major allergen Pru ar 1 [Manihot esculenta]|uniref:Bet v I/Major latex protein domain-containing protein n=1 Tax=Manihot esculenta TaxID=3983 RepID=A0A251LD40_MANES|nr:major allergen Pru ar 1 [Manihot esculenta]OAY56072.1 hypothetical protein MANES_03G200300v8 [Manihot esculenta]OAY56073.1 hypothetical protein MANES_03G200300v8 [Manihot esculenta]